MPYFLNTIRIIFWHNTHKCRNDIVCIFLIANLTRLKTRRNLKILVAEKVASATNLLSQSQAGRCNKSPGCFSRYPGFHINPALILGQAVHFGAFFQLPDGSGLPDRIVGHHGVFGQHRNKGIPCKPCGKDHRIRIQGILQGCGRLCRSS